MLKTEEQIVLATIEKYGFYSSSGDSLGLSGIVFSSSNFGNTQLIDGKWNLHYSSVYKFNKSLLNKSYVYVPQVDIRSNFAMVYGYFTAIDREGNKKCGSEYFQLIKQNEKWLISDYNETIYESCRSIEPRKVELSLINRTLDEWHGLAAVGDSTYFDYFSDGSFYLGTDPKEIWTVQQFKDFAMPYFRRGSAWNFKNKNRNVHLGDYGHYAWFDEILDTWMGLCRGTGVMEKQSEGWKIKQYSLTILVPNSKINEYLKLVKQSN